MLDQIEMHVENFYQKVPKPGSRSYDSALAVFNSPSLPDPLAVLMSETANTMPSIKYAFTYFITSRIALNSGSESSLLPNEFVLLPRTVNAAKSRAATKPGKPHCLFCDL